MAQVYESVVWRGEIKSEKIRKEKMLAHERKRSNSRVEYDALNEKPELYTVLGNLKADEKPIRDFVTKFGWPSEIGSKLVARSDLEIVNALAPRSNQGQKLDLYPFDLFRDELKKFRRVFEAWRAGELLSLSSRDLSTLELMQQKLRQYVQIGIRAQFDEFIPGADVHEAKSLGFTTFADGSIGTAWLQLALAISGGKRIGKCEECGRLFELKPKRRYEQRFCDNKKRCYMRFKRRSQTK